MGRRSEHSREELHQLIVDAALKLVQEQGAQKVTARQIALAVGYTPGMLYSIFTNQQDILMHVNAVGLETLFQACVDARDGSKSPQESILAMGIAYQNFAEQHTHQFELMFQKLKQEAPAPSPVPSSVSNRIQALFALVEDDLRELRPDLSKPQIQLNARALWSGVHGAAALSLNDQLYLPAQTQDQAVIERHISAFLQSFCLPEET